MDEYYRAIRLLPSWLAGALGQLPAQTAAQIHELRFRTGCGVFVTLSGRQLPLQDLPECPLQLRECVLDQFQIEEIFHTLCGGAVHAHQTELAHGFLTTPSGCRVGVAEGRYVDRDGQTVLQQVQGLNLRIARAVPVQLPDELLVQLKKHFIGMLLVGEPDSGKTTLLRHLTGVYRQDSGSVTFDGQPVWENVDVKARIASIPDDWFYFMQAGLRDMMRFYRGLYPKFDQERFEKLREVFALDEKRPLRRMSKGQQKQAAFWLALCTMPDYLILDEPVDGLDPVMRRQVWSLILQDVAERGTTVLVSSHNLRELEDVCDHVGVMSRGKLLLEHSLSELQDYTVKLQLAFEGTELPALPQEIKVLHHAQTGRVHTLICRGSAEELEQQLAALHPIFIDAVPLSLEEIFIYELGGEDYAIRDIVL